MKDAAPIRSNDAIALGPRARTLLIVGLVALALLTAQVAVTRLLAYRFFYHFVFFVISLAQLGLAAAGAWVHASGRTAWSQRGIRAWLLLLGSTPLLVLVCYAWLSPDPNLSVGKIDGLPAQLHLLAIALPLVALNFAGGIVLTQLFATFRRQFGRLYAADLAGAALGCLSCVVAMMGFGPIRAFLVAGLAALLAALLIPRENRRALLPLGLLLAALGAGLAWPGLFDPDVFKPGRRELLQRHSWNHLARTDAPRPGAYIIDGDASTAIDPAGLEDNLLAPEYVLVRPGFDAAVLGVGAGPQLAACLVQGAGSVLAVDINTAILDWAAGEDRVVNGGIFLDPRVEVVAGEARHVLRSWEADHDLVVMHSIDTYTASAAGAYSLSENFLYTREAFEDYLSRLRPGGIISVRRWLFWPPRENLRLFTTIHAALGTSGHADPAAQLAVISPARDAAALQERTWGYLLVSNEPFGEERLARLDRHVRAQGWTWLYRPGLRIATPFQDFVDAADAPADFHADYPYVVTPATDANPFFFQFTLPWSRWLGGQESAARIYASSSTVLFACAAIAIALTLALLGLPLFRRRQELAGDANRGAAVVYFGCLGLGFMAFELPAIQVMTLYLGHPTHALSVVLMGLLASAGVGSLLMHRLPDRAGPFALATVAGLALASGGFLLPLVHATIHWPAPARFALTFGYLLLVGLPLGMPFAAGVRMLDPERPHQVAWAWAVNGATAVVGTCLLMILMVFTGSGAAFLTAAACYLLALVARPGLLRRAAAGETAAASVT